MNKCPRCGSTDVEVVKTWNLVAPIPDEHGRITITVMGVFKCKSCGHSWRDKVSKLKVGGDRVEAETKKGKVVIGGEAAERRVKEIVLDLDEIVKEE